MWPREQRASQVQNNDPTGSQTFAIITAGIPPPYQGRPLTVSPNSLLRFPPRFPNLGHSPLIDVACGPSNPTASLLSSLSNSTSLIDQDGHCQPSTTSLEESHGTADPNKEGLVQLPYSADVVRTPASGYSLGRPQSEPKSLEAAVRWLRPPRIARQSKLSCYRPNRIP